MVWDLNISGYALRVDLMILPSITYTINVLKLTQLIHAFETETGPPERIAYAFRLAKALISTDMEAAKGYIRAAERIALKKNDLAALAEVRRMKGHVCYVDEDYTGALAYIQKALEENRHMHLDVGIAKCLISLGLVYEKLTHYHDAFEIFAKALNIIQQKLLPPKYEARCLACIGLVHERLGDYEAAMEQTRDAMQLCTANGLDALGLQLTSDFALYNLKLNRFHQALPLFQLVLKEYEERSDKRNIATTLTNIARGYYGLKEDNKALEFFQKAVLAQRLLKNRRGYAEALLGMGKLLTRMEGYAEARTLLNQSLEIMEAMEEGDGTCSVLLALAQNALYAKSMGDAESYLLKCVALSTGLGMKFPTVTAFELLAEMARDTGNYALVAEYEKRISELG